MPSSPPHTAAPSRPAPSPAVAAPTRWRDYLTLTKPEITFLVVISALAGFLLGAPAGGVDGLVLLVTLVGVGLTSAGACVMNHYQERHLDAGMRRTANRPLPSGRLEAVQAKRFGVLLVCAGVGLICPLVNPLTAGLAILTVLLYLYVYTPLKQTTKYNTLVGTIPGALPALGGYAAATNSLGAGGWAVFAILVVWQMPHFLSLAWIYRKDYGRGGFAMLPVVEPEGHSTGAQALGWTLLLLPVSLLPFALGVSSWLYAAGAVLLGLYFLRPAFAFFRNKTTRNARRVLKASVYYIPLLVLLIVVDRLLG